MKYKSKALKFKNQSILLNKVIVMEGYRLIGSGYLITKCSDGKQRLDVIDLKGNIFEPQLFQIQQNGPVMIGVTSFKIN